MPAQASMKQDVISLSKGFVSFVLGMGRMPLCMMHNMPERQGQCSHWCARCDMGREALC